MNFAQDKNPASKVGGIAFVIAFHIFLVYALLTGLATKAVKALAPPIETKIIEEVKPPPPDVPPPPPPPKMVAPPPPYIPPPEIQISQPPPANAITVKTDVKPPDNRLPPPVQEAPPVVAPPPTIQGSLDPNKNCSRHADYPALSKRVGEEGTVLLEVLIDVDGKVLDARVKQSSGHARLDEASRASMATPGNCKGKPTVVDGSPQQTWVPMKYTWRLTDE